MDGYQCHLTIIAVDGRTIGGSCQYAQRAILLNHSIEAVGLP